MNEDRSQDQKNTEHRTLFEAALAGDDISNYNISPSAAIVASLHQLLGEVDDAPVTQARLREFIHDDELTKITQNTYSNTLQNQDRPPLEVRTTTAVDGSPHRASRRTKKPAFLLAIAAVAITMLSLVGLWSLRSPDNSTETATGGTQIVEGGQFGKPDGGAAANLDLTVDPSVDPAGGTNPSLNTAPAAASSADQSQGTGQLGDGSDTLAPETPVGSGQSADDSTRTSIQRNDQSANTDDPSSTDPEQAGQAETSKPTNPEQASIGARPTPQSHKEPPSTEPGESSDPTTPGSTTLKPTSPSLGKPALVAPAPDGNNQAGDKPQNADNSYIGDTVHLDRWTGAGQGEITVELFDDSNRDGSTDFLLDTQVTSADGHYSFSVGSGCYVVRFTAPDGFYIDEAYAQQSFCVGSGEVLARIDSIVNQTG